MYKLPLTLVLLLLCSDISFAQEFSYNSKQATFLEAESAKLYQSDKGVLLSVIGLNPESKVGVELTIEGLTEPEIEVTRLIEFQGITVGVYPPLLLKPTEGVYLVLGKPGEQYGVRARTTEGIKHFVILLEGVEEPDVPSDPDPPPSGNLLPADLAAISSLSSANKPADDPITTRYITEALNKLSLSEVLGEAALEMKVAIGDALVESMKEVRPPYKNWNKFRVALNDAIVKLVADGKVTNGKDLTKVKDAVVSGLNSSASLQQNGTIILYYRDGCDLCIEWLRDVYPRLQAIGWKLQKVKTTKGSVPKFVICDNNKCSEEIAGYMDDALFKLYAERLR
jgi:hypothetical protein